MIFNVFRRGLQQSGDRQTKKGFNPYKKRAGVFGSKSYLVDETTKKVNKLEEGFHGFSGQQVDRADAFLTEQQGKWQAAGMRDAREGYAKAQMERASTMREDASEDLTGMRAQARPSNTAEAQSAFNNRVQGFRRARNKLKQAQESAGKIGGPEITYSGTGYEALDPTIDKFYADFDRQIAERRAEYVSQYGGSNYDDLVNEGYASGAGADINEDYTKLRASYWTQLMQEEGNTWSDMDLRNQASARAMEELGLTDQDMVVGKQDIDALVLGDMLDMSMYDLAFLDTSPVTYDKDGNEQKFRIDDTMAEMREGLGKLYMSTAEGADEMASLEDASRAEVARVAQLEGEKTAALTRQRSEESIANQMSDIQASQRNAEKIRDKQMASLTDAGSLRGKRVKGVDFTEERPQ